MRTRYVSALIHQMCTLCISARAVALRVRKWLWAQALTQIALPHLQVPQDPLSQEQISQQCCNSLKSLRTRNSETRSRSFASNSRHAWAIFVLRRRTATEAEAVANVLSRSTCHDASPTFAGVSLPPPRPDGRSSKQCRLRRSRPASLSTYRRHPCLPTHPWQVPLKTSDDPAGT